MTKIGIIKNTAIHYDAITPFHPGQQYPEYPFKALSETNSVYAAVRDIFRQLGMDATHYGQSQWNPFCEFVQPGDNVLIKPNFVNDSNPVSDFDCLVTHGSIIRAVLDYVYIALKGQGSVTIGDAPIQICDFEQLISRTGLHQIADFFNRLSGFHLDIADLRIQVSHRYKTGLISRSNKKHNQSEYIAVDMKQESELMEIIDDFEKFRVVGYDKHEMKLHHNRDKNEYLISHIALQADVIINLAKLKTHRKGGLTCSLKNIVGINGLKDWLPHHRTGSCQEGGDEYLYKSLRKRLQTILTEKLNVAGNQLLAALLRTACLGISATAKFIPFKEPYLDGGWYGNDTLPRMVADLNRIAVYADKNGILQDTPQRKFFILVDGIIAGEKEGPLRPSPRHCGILVAGFEPTLVDIVCSRIMGFDWTKIPQFKYALKKRTHRICRIPLEAVEFMCGCCANLADVSRMHGEHFVPSKGWCGHIEL